MVCTGDVERAEVEAMTRMPGFERLSDPAGKMVGRRWCAVYSSPVAADMAVFAVNGRGSRAGFLFQASRGARSVQSTAPASQMNDIDDIDALPTGPTSSATQPQDAAAALREMLQGSSRLPAFSTPPPLPSKPVRKPLKKRATKPRAQHLLHIPPPSVLRNPRTHLPAKMSFKALRELNSGYQYFHVRSGRDKAAFVLGKTVRLDDANKAHVKVWEPEGEGTTAVQMLTSVGVRWGETRPAMAEIKKAVIKKTALLKCDVRIPKRVAVLSFKTQAHAQAGLDALNALKNKSPTPETQPSFELLSEERVTLFIKGE